MRGLALVLLFLLLLLVAIALCRGPSPAAAVLGGAALVLAPVQLGKPEPDEAVRPREPEARGAPPESSPLSRALQKHLQIDAGEAPAVHPLDATKYTVGGAAKPGTNSRGTKWQQYKTWRELFKDESAFAAYSRARTAALTEPDFDWTAVLAQVNPLLKENREYIGLINLDKDGRTLRVLSLEASPVAIGHSSAPGVVAEVPGEVVMRYADRPALFIFHTHPETDGGWPLPSSEDLSVAIYLAAAGRYAASVVISEYGPVLYTLTWPGYQALHRAKNWNTAVAHMRHDVAAAHDARRAWAEYSLADYAEFYSRHRLMYVPFPTSRMVADALRMRWTGDIEAEVSHELTDELRAELRTRKGGDREVSPPTSGEPPAAREAEPKPAPLAGGLEPHPIAAVRELPPYGDGDHIDAIFHEIDRSIRTDRVEQEKIDQRSER